MTQLTSFIAATIIAGVMVTTGAGATGGCLRGSGERFLHSDTRAVARDYERCGGRSTYRW